MNYLKRAIWVFVLAFGCSDVDKKETSGSENAPVISVSIDQDTKVELSSFVEGIEYTILKTPENKLMGEVLKIISSDTHYGFFDPSRSTVWIYDKALNFVKDIVIPAGDGPGELQYLSDVSFGKDNSVYMLGLFKVIKFDVEGNILKEIPIKFQATKLAYIPSEEVFVAYMINTVSPFTNDKKQSYNLIYFNEDGEVLKGALPIDDRKKGIRFATFNNFPVNNNEHLFFSHLDYSIYEINGLEVSVKYTLDFGEYAVPDETFDLRKNYGQHHEFMSREIESKKYAYTLGKVLATEKYLYTAYLQGNFSGYFIRNRISNKTMPVSKFINDIDNGTMPYLYATENNAFLGILEPNIMVRHLNDLYENNTELYKNPKTRVLIELSRKIDNYSNPIFVKMRSK